MLVAALQEKGIWSSEPAEYWPSNTLNILKLLKSYANKGMFILLLATLCRRWDLGSSRVQCTSTAKDCRSIIRAR